MALSVFSIAPISFDTLLFVSLAVQSRNIETQHLIIGDFASSNVHGWFHWEIITFVCVFAHDDGHSHQDNDHGKEVDRSLKKK